MIMYKLIVFDIYVFATYNDFIKKVKTIRSNNMVFKYSL